MTKQLTQDSMQNLIWGDYNPTEWESVAGSMESEPYKHDTSYVSEVFHRFGDDTYWRVSYFQSYNDGTDTDSLECQQVEPVEVVRTEWKALTQ